MANNGHAGNIQPGLDLEEHNHEARARRVTLVGTTGTDLTKVPVQVLNSDNTDNSLSSGGQIGQKVMEVGRIPLSSSTDSVGTVNQSVTTLNLVNFVSTPTPISASAEKVFSPGGTRATFYDLNGYEGVNVSFIDNTSGAGAGKLYIRWSPDNTNTAYNDPNDGTGGTSYHAIDFTASNKNPYSVFVPKRARYVNFVFVNGSTTQGTTYPNVAILDITAFPTFFTNGVEVLGKVSVDGSGSTSDTGVLVAGYDSVSAPTTVIPLAMDSAGKPSIFTLTGSTVANNATESGNPHKIGFTANSSVPTAVTTGRRVTAWGDLNGRGQVSLGDPGVSLLASGARTTTQTSADLTNATGRGIVVIMDATTVTAGASLVVTIDAKDPASGKYYNLLTGAAIVAVSTNVYRIYPGLAAVAGTVSDVLPRTFRIVVTPADNKSVTYSVGYNIIP